MKACNTYISSIFLYNSEIWTLTINRENKLIPSIEEYSENMCVKC